MDAFCKIVEKSINTEIKMVMIKAESEWIQPLL